MVILGLPAFNEELSIDPLFTRIQEMQDSARPFRVVVFDDGSTDATVERALRWRNRIDLVVIQGGVNCGLGAAIRGLIRYFLDSATDDDVLVLMDCDDTHDPAQVPDLLAALSGTGAQGVAIASRYRRGSTTTGVPPLRMVASWGVLGLYKSVFPIRNVRDYSCGYRAYRYAALARIAADTERRIVDENGFASMPELLLRAHRAGSDFVEVPLQLHYGRRLSESKMPVTGNSMRLLRKLVEWRGTL